MDNTSNLSIPISDPGKKEMGDLEPQTSLRHGQQVTIRADARSSPEIVDLATGVELSVIHRKLNARQIQLTSIAGSIGAALFVAIGSGVRSGPLALLVAFVFLGLRYLLCRSMPYVSFLVLAQQNILVDASLIEIEIVTLFPVDGAFIRLAGRMVDPSLGVLVGWNHFFSQTSFVVFECTIINSLIEYWGYNQSPAILISISIVMYMAINIYRADLFGEAEFWLALGKVLLALGLILFTLVVMLGGNPLNDRFGFRYWRDPGPWAGDDASNRLISFLNALNVAGFCIVGPEYISMIAGEAKDPRRTVPRAFATIVNRLIIFFIGGALCVGILVPYDDPTLTNGANTFSGSSPYVIAMSRLKIPVLHPSSLPPPHHHHLRWQRLYVQRFKKLACFGIGWTSTSDFPSLKQTVNKPPTIIELHTYPNTACCSGVPYMAVLAVTLLSCISFLALSSSTAVVLGWILNFCTAAAMLNWTVISFTWIRFNAAMKAQNIDRNTFLPNPSRFQPFAGYFAFCCAFVVLWVQGYGVFLKGQWDVATFIFNYGIIALTLTIGLGWKLIKRTPFYNSKDVDLTSGLDFFDALTEHYRKEREGVPVTRKDKIWAKLF
ncbi:hypothetical protein CEP52_004263 [Fusarium oligoseptatum]|uniref:Amino acid permease/ SLC12A domain-containing protein n=1 Tax=Fusarium oligoseptatum TaxID=2604345 RepID=A0A428U4G7_9HYPO|nr:hypothetical protein CEP52_004263 [Fusarium oligoseptatum]